MRVAVLLVLALAWTAPARAGEPVDWRPVLEKGTDGTPVIVLHVAPCFIREVEPKAIPFAPQKAGDCETLNRATAAVRQAAFRRLRLPAGRYVFRVLNGEVAWSSGFELRGALDAGLPRTRDDAIAPGAGKDFRVDLVPGRYLFRCPNGPTPEYPLLVEG